MRRGRKLAIGALLAAVAGGGACVNATEHGEAAPRPADAVIEVENANWSDMAVYLTRNGVRHRLGTVTSMNRERFVVRSSLVGTDHALRIVARAIGSGATYTSPTFMLDPNRRVEVRLQNNLRLSSLAVW